MNGTATSGNPSQEHYVYLLTAMASGRMYIGITNNLRRRWNDHVSAAFRNAAKGNILHRAIRKYGTKGFTVKCLYIATSRREAEVVERGLIAAYGTMAPRGMNLTSGGEGTPDFRRPHTPETRAKISAGNEGKTFSAATIEKMRLAKLGKSQSEEHKKAGAEARRGKVKSAETREKMSQSAKRACAIRRASRPAKFLIRKQSDERGISWDYRRQKWSVEIHSAGKRLRLGRFADISDATQVRDEAARTAIRLPKGPKPRH